MRYVELQLSLTGRQMRLAGGRGLKAQILRRQIEITAKQRSQQSATDQMAPAILLEAKPLHFVSFIC